jgi:hypothetical protein
MAAPNSIFELSCPPQWCRILITRGNARPVLPRPIIIPFDQNATEDASQRFNATAAGQKPGLACLCATHSRHECPPQSRFLVRQEFEDAWHSGQVTTEFPIWGRAEAIPRWNVPRLTQVQRVGVGPDRIGPACPFRLPAILSTQSLPQPACFTCRSARILQCDLFPALACRDSATDGLCTTQ